MDLNANHSAQESITESQRACLRLVGEGMSSKEIAIKTGLSPRTVDEYVNRASKTLGATNRREAARILAFRESGASKKLQLQSQAIALPPISDSLGDVGNHDGVHRQGPALLRWIPPIGGGRHDLTIADRLYAILRVSIVTTGTATAIIATIYWLNSLSH